MEISKIYSLTHIIIIKLTAKYSQYITNIEVNLKLVKKPISFPFQYCVLLLVTQ